MRKFGEIVAACVRVAQKNPTLEVHRDDKEFWRWKDCILSREEYLLESICFDLNVEVPYNHLLKYTEQLGIQTRQLIRAAWSFLNDATLTMLCVLWHPRTIAAAALYCAAKHHNIEFPDKDGKPWWEVVGCRIRDIKKCCNYMALVYEYVPPIPILTVQLTNDCNRNNPLRGDDRPRYVTTPETGTETTKTRQRAPSTSRSPLPPEKRSRPDDDREELERKRVKVEDRNGGATATPVRRELPKREEREEGEIKSEREEGEATENPDLEEGELDD